MIEKFPSLKPGGKICDSSRKQLDKLAVDEIPLDESRNDDVYGMKETPLDESKGDLDDRFSYICHHEQLNLLLSA